MNVNWRLCANCKEHRASTSADPIFVHRFVLGDLSREDEVAHVKSTSSISNIRRFIRSAPELNFRTRELLTRKIADYDKSTAAGVVIVFQSLPNQLYDDNAIDFAGSFIVLRNFYMMLRLETNMYFLSSMGGGFSALGDFSESFAEKALSVSKYQIELARNMGDEVMLARCYIYVGFAFTQLDLYAEAFQIMIYVRHLARQLKSQMLKDLTIALFIKIAQFAQKRRNDFIRSRQFQNFYKKVSKNTNTCNYVYC
ncbi:hypothetical protein M3Y95_00082200 [Aphelenchoides besseyi]|nr:hypothetical protein M3Y95_00082200 [Aphelenchoides besseyi]